MRARLIEIMQLQMADNAKSWLLKPDGKYERVQAKAGVPTQRCQAKFIEMTRDRVKAAEMAVTGGRFHLLQARGKLDGKGPEARRVRREPREGKKSP
jgi:hypothetical protein